MNECFTFNVVIHFCLAIAEFPIASVLNLPHFIVLTVDGSLYWCPLDKLLHLLYSL